MTIPNHARVAETISDRFFRATLEPLFPSIVRPNHLTVARLLLIPPVMYFLVAENYAVGVPLFLIAAATDWFDGALARIRGQITPWGIMYDPVVDKLLVGSVLFFVVLAHINALLGYAILVVEAGVLIYSVHQQRRGIIRQANRWGKTKMAAEVAGITLLLGALWFDIDLLVHASAGMLAVALVLALLSIYSRLR